MLVPESTDSRIAVIRMKHDGKLALSYEVKAKGLLEAKQEVADAEHKKQMKSTRSLHSL